MFQSIFKISEFGVFTLFVRGGPFGLFQMMGFWYCEMMHKGQLHDAHVSLSRERKQADSTSNE